MKQELTPTTVAPDAAELAARLARVREKMKAENLDTYVAL